MTEKNKYLLQLEGHNLLKRLSKQKRESMAYFLSRSHRRELSRLGYLELRDLDNSVSKSNNKEMYCIECSRKG